MPGAPLKFNCGEYYPGAEPYSSPPIQPTVPSVYIPEPITTIPPWKPPGGQRWACEQRLTYCPETFDPETGMPNPRVLELVERKCVPCSPGAETGFTLLSVVGAGGECPFMSQAECESRSEPGWRLPDGPQVGTYECKNYSQPCPQPGEGEPPGGPGRGPGTGGPGTGGPGTGGPGTGGPGTGGPTTGGPGDAGGPTTGGPGTGGPTTGGGVVTGSNRRWKCIVTDYPCPDDLGTNPPANWNLSWPRIAYRIRLCEECATPPDGIAWSQACKFDTLPGCEAGVYNINGRPAFDTVCNNYDTLSNCEPVITEPERRWKCSRSVEEYCPPPLNSTARAFRYNCEECFRASELETWPEGCNTDPTCGGSCMGIVPITPNPCMVINPGGNTSVSIPKEFRNAL